MKKFLFFVPILLLIIFTTITKNSTKKLDKKIFQIKENIRILEDKYELVLLDYNYLSSPQKLMEYQSKYFEDELKDIDVTSIKKLTVFDDQIEVKKFID